MPPPLPDTLPPLPDVLPPISKAQGLPDTLPPLPDRLPPAPTPPGVSDTDRAAYDRWFQHANDNPQDYARQLGEIKVSDPQRHAKITSEMQSRGLREPEPQYKPVLTGAAQSFATGGGYLSQTLLAAPALVEAAARRFVGPEPTAEDFSPLGSYLKVQQQRKEAERRAASYTPRPGVGGFAQETLDAAAGSLPQMAGPVAAGALTKVAPLATSAAQALQRVGVSAAVGGLTTTAQTLQQNQDTSGRGVANALAQGLIEAAFMKLGGASGVEAVFKTGGHPAVVQSIKEAMRHAAVEAGKEIPEEALTSAAQEASDQLIGNGTFDPTQITHAALIGGATGGAMGAGFNAHPIAQAALAQRAKIAPELPAVLPPETAPALQFTETPAPIVQPGVEPAQAPIASGPVPAPTPEMRPGTVTPNAGGGDLQIVKRVSGTPGVDARYLVATPAGGQLPTAIPEQTLKLWQERTGWKDPHALATTPTPASQPAPAVLAPPGPPAPVAAAPAVQPVQEQSPARASVAAPQPVTPKPDAAPATVPAPAPVARPVSELPADLSGLTPEQFAETYKNRPSQARQDRIRLTNERIRRESLPAPEETPSGNANQRQVVSTAAETVGMQPSRIENASTRTTPAATPSITEPQNSPPRPAPVAEAVTHAPATRETVAPGTPVQTAPHDLGPRGQAWNNARKANGEHKLAGRTVLDPETGAAHEVVDVNSAGDMLLADDREIPFDEAQDWKIKGAKADVPISRFVSSQLPAAAPVAATPVSRPHLEQARAAGVAEPVDAAFADKPNQKSGLLGGHGHVVVESSLENAAVTSENTAYGVFVGYHPESGKWLVFGADPQRARKAQAREPFSILTPSDTPLVTGKTSETQSLPGEALRGANLVRQKPDGTWESAGAVDTAPKLGRDLFNTKAEARAQALKQAALRKRKNRTVAAAPKVVVAPEQRAQVEAAVTPAAEGESGDLSLRKGAVPEQESRERSADKKTDREMAIAAAAKITDKAALETKLAGAFVLHKKQQELLAQRKAIADKYAEERTKLAEDVRGGSQTSERAKKAKARLSEIANAIEAELPTDYVTSITKLSQELAPYAEDLKAYQALLQPLPALGGGARSGAVWIPGFTPKPRPSVAPIADILEPKHEAKFKPRRGTAKIDAEGVGKYWRMLKNVSTAVPHLKQAQDAWLREKLVQKRGWRPASFLAGNQTVNDILSKVPEEQRPLFEHAVVVQNLFHDMTALNMYQEELAKIPIFGEEDTVDPKTGQTIDERGQVGRDNLTKAYKEIQAKLADPANKDVADALALRHRMVEQIITEPAIARGQLDATQLGRPWFHQTTLEVHNLRDLLTEKGRSASGATPEGMFKGRTGTGAAFNTLYRQVETVSFAQAHLAQWMHEYNTELKSKSQLPKFVDLAKTTNKENAEAALAATNPGPAVSSGLRVLGWWVNSGHSIGGFDQHAELLNKLGAAYGVSENKLAKVVYDPKNAIAISQLHADLIGKNGAMVEAWLRGAGVSSGSERFGVLGPDKYIDSRDWSPGSKIRGLLDKHNTENNDSLVAYQDSPGNQLVPMQVLSPVQKAMWEQDIAAEEKRLKRKLTAAETAALEHKVKGFGVTVEAMLGAAEPPLIIPRRWREAILEEDAGNTPPGAWTKGQGKVSAFLLRNVLTGPAWLKAQALSNGAMLAVSQPQAYMKLKAATALLHKISRKQALTGEEARVYQEAVKAGVLNTGHARTMEHLDEAQLRAFQAMGEQLDLPLWKMSIDATRSVVTGNNKVMDAAVAIVDDAPKLAIFMRLHDMTPQKIIEQGYRWGISSRTELERLRDQGGTAKDLAGKIAREATGDYLSMSPMGRKFARTIFPFYRWYEASTHVAVRQVINTVDPRNWDSVEGAAANATRLAVLFATFGFAARAFNRAMWGNDDQDRLDRAGGPASIIVGKNKDGSLRTVPVTSVIGDTLARVQMHDVLWNPNRQVSVGGITHSFAFNLMDQIGTLGKAVAQAGTGITWNSYQGTWRQAYVSSPREAAALALQTVGLRILAKRVDPNAVDQPFSVADLMSSSHSATDMDFFAGRQAVANVAAKLYPDEVVGGMGRKASHADVLFRSAMAAIDSGDQAAAVDYLSQYFTGGKQYANFAEAIKARGVFNGVSKLKEAEIRAAMNPDQQAEVAAAERAFEKISQSPLLEQALQRSLATGEQQRAYNAAHARAIVDEARVREQSGLPVEMEQLQKAVEAKQWLKAKTKYDALTRRLAKDPDNADYAEPLQYLEDYLNEHAP